MWLLDCLFAWCSTLKLQTPQIPALPPSTLPCCYRGTTGKHQIPRWCRCYETRLRKAHSLCRCVVDTATHGSFNTQSFPDNDKPTCNGTMSSDTHKTRKLLKRVFSTPNFHMQSNGQAGPIQGPVGSATADCCVLQMGTHVSRFNAAPLNMIQWNIWFVVWALSWENSEGSEGIKGCLGELTQVSILHSAQQQGWRTGRWVA